VETDAHPDLVLSAQLWTLGFQFWFSTLNFSLPPQLRICRDTSGSGESDAGERFFLHDIPASGSRRQFGPFVQRAEIFLIGEDAVTFLAGDFADETELNQKTEGGIGCWGTEVKFCHEPGHGDDGILLQDFMQLERGKAFAAFGVQACAVLLKKLDQTAGGFGGLIGRFLYSAQKEIQPRLPVAVGAHALE